MNTQTFAQQTGQTIPESKTGIPVLPSLSHQSSKLMKPTLRPFPTALLNPCIDPIFKILFTTDSEESHQALTCFLCDLIGKPVTDVVLQPNELSGEAISDKQSEFDINCKVDGKIADIEMQGRNDASDYGKRAEYHVAHLLNHYTPKGSAWIEIPEVFQISVLNFIFDKEEESAINHYLLRNVKGRAISSTMNVIFMELPKIAKLPDDIDSLTPAQMWGKFFLYGSDPEKQDYIQELEKRNRGISMAFTVLDHVSQDEANWYHESRYWMHVSDEKTRLIVATQNGHDAGLAEGIDRGRSEGIEVGQEEKAREIAANLLKAGIPVEQVATFTNLSIEQVKELASSN